VPHVRYEKFATAYFKFQESLDLNESPDLLPILLSEPETPEEANLRTALLLGRSEEEGRALVSRKAKPEGKRAKPARRRRRADQVEPYTLEEVLEDILPGVPDRTLKETGFGSKIGKEWFFLDSDIRGLMEACRTKSSKTQKVESSSSTQASPVNAYDRALELATKKPQSTWRPKLSVVNCENRSTVRRKKPRSKS